MKLAIVTTHPIQYNAPFFRLLQERGKVQVRVFYTWGEMVLKDKFDPGFNRAIAWDIPLLEGYDLRFVENSAPKKGSHHFFGIINPHLIKTLEEYDPDALLVYGWSLYGHLKAMRHFKGKKPVILRGDSTMLDKRPFYKAWARRQFLKWVYKHIDYALYVGKNNFDYYKSMGLEDRQLIYGPHAVDNGRFSDEAAGYDAGARSLRRELSIPEDAIVFLFAGKFEEKKDPDILLRAFTGSGLGEKGAYLIMVGNGQTEQEIKEKYRQVPSIRFMDFQNQSRMPVIYRIADVFVLPSRGPDETWGLAVNEAMACGRAILVSDRCGCAADLVIPGENGLIFQATDEKDLVDKLLLLGKDKAALGRMGAASLNRIAGFTFENLAGATEKLLYSIG